MATREAPYVTETFFRGLKGLLLSLPSEEEKAELIGTLMEAQKLLEELRDTEARAAALEEELQAMATDDVVASLERSNESVAVLAALARRLGMRVGSKGRKSDLAKRIATRIANQRSYDFLRNRTARAS